MGEGGFFFERWSWEEELFTNDDKADGVFCIRPLEFVGDVQILGFRFWRIINNYIFNACGDPFDRSTSILLVLCPSFLF